MKGSDKAIVLGVVMAVVLIGFYLKVLSPKRAEVASLKTEITTLQSQVDQERQVAAFGEQARQEFPVFYSRLVVLGKAVPEEADAASLLVQLNTVARRTGIKFVGLEVGSTDASSESSASSSSGSTSTTSPASPSTGSSSSPTSSTTPPTTTPPTTTPAPATEAGAASLPIGATVGAAGLPTLPYDLNFSGTYFNVADFLKGVDELVHLRADGQVASDGRLLTINGFSLEPPPNGTGSNPELKVTLSVNTYMTPATEGLTAGASPSGPGSVPTQPQTQAASQVVAQ